MSGTFLSITPDLTSCGQVREGDVERVAEGRSGGADSVTRTWFRLKRQADATRPCGENVVDQQKQSRSEDFIHDLWLQSHAVIPLVKRV